MLAPRAKRSCRKLAVQTLESRRLLAGDMMNPANPLDVNNDTRVTASDALAIINYIGQNSAQGESVGTATFPSDIFPDTNGDELVRVSDALRVINRLAQGEQVEPPAPDLSIGTASVASVTSQVLDLELQVSNSGEAIEGSVTVDVQIVDSVGEPILTRSFDLNVRNDSTVDRVAIDVSDLNPGAYGVRVTADPNDDEDETNEENNSLEITTGFTIPEIVVPRNEVVRALEVHSGKSPRIEFDGDNVVARVTSPSAGILNFTAAGQSQSLSIKYDLKIKASGSNNLLIFDGAIIPDDLLIYVSGNGNTVAMDGAQIGDDLIYHGGDGTDSIGMRGNTRIGDDAIIKLKKGNDLVAIVDTTIGDDFLLYGDRGIDLLAVDSVSVGDDAIIRMGSENDTASFRNATVHDVADIEGDQDFDTLAADVNSVTARKLRIDEFEAEGSLLNAATIVDGLFSDLGEIDTSVE